MAITKVGAIVYIYDDSDATGGHAAGSPHTFAEISAAFPADLVSNGTNVPSYRGVATIQVGDTGTGTATTTLPDTVGSTVIWDSTKTLQYRTTQTTSWFTVLGTKVGAGDVASGHKGTTLVFGGTTTIRGTLDAYGSTLRMGVTGAVPLTFLLPTGGGGELINCLMQSQATSSNAFSFTGSSANSFDTIYNVDWTGATSGTLVNNWWSRASERLTFGGSNGRQMVPLTATSMTLKDVAFFGTPTTSDIAWNVGTIASQQMVRRMWSNNAPKFGFSTGTTNTPVLDFATLELWLYDVKVVDGSGTAISGIPVRLTDSIGNVQVDAITGSDGMLSYGSGLTTNAVVVMDHYSNGTIYVQRHRGPFYVEINTPNLTGYNPSYASRQKYFVWPGAESVTTTAGSFEDVQDIVNLTEPSGGQTSWTECTL